MSAAALQNVIPISMVKNEIKIEEFPDQTIRVLEARDLKTSRDDEHRPDFWLATNNEQIYFTRTSRDLKRIDICVADIKTGEVSCEYRYQNGRISISGPYRGKLPPERLKCGSNGEIIIFNGTSWVDVAAYVKSRDAQPHQKNERGISQMQRLPTPQSQSLPKRAEARFGTISFKDYYKSNDTIELGFQTNYGIYHYVKIKSTTKVTDAAANPIDASAIKDGMAARMTVKATHLGLVAETIQIINKVPPPEVFTVNWVTITYCNSSVNSSS